MPGSKRKNKEIERMRKVVLIGIAVGPVMILTAALVLNEVVHLLSVSG